ncbi:hypothetical protein LPJ66_009865 [Kickxella alabastrina]|uniref:Uncharacterized protein n=1 Tax=Kickxella alabastrina TaxID=61397 RepID=A0ACC1I4K3_9FUNG|nr:hypothetical protein LPJ66_009865 [Kickxella alabastrina]
MVAPIRTALFELWPDGLPVRFRDLRDSLYAVDWNLYEAASVPLKVFKYGSPYVYETYNTRTTFAHTLPSRTSMAGERPAAQQLMHGAAASRPSISISVNRKYSSTVSSPDPLSVAVTKKKRNGINTTAQNRGALSSVVAGSLSPRVSSEANSTNAFIDTRRPSTTHTTVPNMGLFELINTLGQISDRERGIIMSALEKIGTVPEDESPAFLAGENTCAGQTQIQTQRSDIYSGTLNSTTATVVRQGTIKGGQNSRAATAATIAATAQLYVDTGNCGGGGAVDNSTRCLNTTSNHSSANDDFGAMSGVSGVPGVRQRPAIVMRVSNDSDEQHQPADMIRLRTRPLTTMACSSRPLSNIFTSADVRMSMAKQPINLASTTTPLFAQVQEAAAAAAAEEQARLTHARKLSNRKSDSALTTATRSMRAAENLYYCDSVDNELRSPEFTIIHPAIDLRTSARRGRFAFIKKISHMLTPH